MSTVVLPRPAERVAIVSFLLVFLCGVAAGAVAMNYWGAVHSPHTDKFSFSVREWREQLNLTDSQTRELTSILDDFSHYYDSVLAYGQSRVLQILTEEQKRKYEEMIRQHKK